MTLQRKTPLRQQPTKKRRRKPSDGPWRNDVLKKRGQFCRACARSYDLQADHMIPRSQGGPSIVANGLPMCGPFAGDCHGKRTRYELKIERDWLDQDQVDWLADQGHAVWEADGSVSGRHRKLFAPMRNGER